MIGILAYGSLIADPGWELEQANAWSIPDVTTPFAVEYARSSRSRGGAPTLIPVPGEFGTPVQGIILVLNKAIREPSAMNMLYRREIHRIGDASKTYSPARPNSQNAVTIQRLNNFASVPVVLYASFPANIPEIQDNTLSIQQKVGCLAQLAEDSLKDDTYWKSQDGIQYLAAAIHYGVNTALTEAYSQAILEMADHAPDLAEARLRIARQKGIIP